MTEQLISFKTAMIAKKVGFNWTLGFALEYREDGTIINLEYSADEGVCNCVTQSLLQKWLREEYDFHISIDCNASGWYGDIRKTNGTRVFNYKYIDTETGYYDTYEKALETGLQEALKLI